MEQPGFIDINGFKLRYHIKGKDLDAAGLPLLLVYGRFEFLVAPVYSWDPVRPKFKNLTIRIFEKSVHSPQYEQPDLFDPELLNWLREN